MTTNRLYARAARRKQRLQHGHLDVRSDHCFSTANRSPHRFAKHRMDTRTAVLHFARDANDRALAYRAFRFRNPHLSICFSYGASDGTCDLFRDREKAAYMRPLPRHNSRRSVMTRSTSRRWSSSETSPAPPVPVGRNCPGPYMAGCAPKQTPAPPNFHHQR